MEASQQSGRNRGVDEGVLTVKDKTFFGENSTTIVLGGAEVERRGTAWQGRLEVMGDLQIAAVEWRRGIAEEEEEEKNWKKGRSKLM
ncbi:unnamed protein product [Cladocopium goreaui]|uniref:Uncharacterized protein n=1 Tax=Cladocopium goreaui TaxID=2562237 RepID=A0A9P1GPN4_9DINO|nr:unnamed protein product [Cladocopium goreaui]